MSDTYILCLETSGPSCSVALSLNGQCISIEHSTGEWKHSQYLTTKIEECFKKVNFQMQNLNAVAISQGPGSYTGLRVGASTAKGICFGLDIPLIAIDTLKIISSPERQKINGTDLKYIIPLIDARRDEVYYNIYNVELEAQTETKPHILQEDSFQEIISKGAVICGDGALKAAKILNLTSHSSCDQSFPSAQYMDNLSFVKYQSNSFEDIAYFSPFYLKPPNITKSKKSLF